VAPMAFSQAITASGWLEVRASMPLAMTGAINLRILGPTAQVTFSNLSVKTLEATGCC
jgi:hypothetical protein